MAAGDCYERRLQDGWETRIRQCGTGSALRPLDCFVAGAPRNDGANRDLVHKIGVTNMDVKQRIAGARLQPTFLMADVDIAATYELYNINRVKLENLIHRIFQPAQLDIQIMDRFGQLVVPKEWFLVPLFAIDEAVERIKNGTIAGCVYDPNTAKLTEAKGQ